MVEAVAHRTECWLGQPVEGLEFVKDAISAPLGRSPRGRDAYRIDCERVS
jgi:hypothetical protein